MRRSTRGGRSMVAYPLGLLLCKTLPGNRRVADRSDESHGVRRKRHWPECSPEREPAVEADVCGAEHAGGFAERGPWKKVWSAPLLQGFRV